MVTSVFVRSTVRDQLRDKLAATFWKPFGWQVESSSASTLSGTSVHSKKIAESLGIKKAPSEKGAFPAQKPRLNALKVYPYRLATDEFLGTHLGGEVIYWLIAMHENRSWTDLLHKDFEARGVLVHGA